MKSVVFNHKSSQNKLPNFVKYCNSAIQNYINHLKKHLTITFYNLHLEVVDSRHID